MKDINLSVVLITWSPSEYRMNLLRHTLESLKACTTIPYTLVVVDNGPKEQTEFLRSLEPDIHIINRVNQGPGVARSQGALATRSRYIAFLDNDLEFYPDWLATSLELLARFPEKKFIVAPARSCPVKHGMNFLERWPDGHELFRMAAGYCLVMPRAAFEEIGLWITNDLDAIEDRDYANRAYAKGYAFLWPPGGRVRHCGRYKSFSKKKHLIDGVWV